MYSNREKQNNKSGAYEKHVFLKKKRLPACLVNSRTNFSFFIPSSIEIIENVDWVVEVTTT